MQIFLSSNKIAFKSAFRRSCFVFSNKKFVGHPDPVPPPPHFSAKSFGEKTQIGAKMAIFWVKNANFFLAQIKMPLKVLLGVFALYLVIKSSWAILTLSPPGETHGPPSPLEQLIPTLSPSWRLIGTPPPEGIPCAHVCVHPMGNKKLGMF